MLALEKSQNNQMSALCLNTLIFPRNIIGLQYEVWYCNMILLPFDALARWIEMSLLSDASPPFKYEYRDEYFGFVLGLE